MPVVVTNQSTTTLNIPLVEDVLRGGETRSYSGVEYDLFVNDYRIRDLIDRHLITVASEDDIPFASRWNGEPKFHMGDYHYWVDENGDTRIKQGDATSDADGDTLGSGSKNQPVLSLHAYTQGRSFAQLRATFFNSMSNQGMGTWDNLYKYCMWSFSLPNSTTWSTPQRYTTQDALFSWLEANLPSAGGVYTENIVRFRLTEEENTSDTFPTRLVHRNSLVASMMGRGQWVSRWTTERSGVSSQFNAPSYYLNYYNELGIRFVQEATGNTPGTNNDGVVWYSNRRRSMWGLPQIGASVNLNLPNQRKAVWDNTGMAWVAPAPTGGYTLQQPFILHEYRKNRILGIESSTGPVRRYYELNAVSALVYPAVNGGRYYSFVVYPMNTDVWATEWIDTSVYEMQLKLVYSQTNRPTYVSLTPLPTFSQERMMWSHFPVGGGNSLLFPKNPSQITSHVDSAVVPSKVYLCRREKATGIRSRWTHLYNVKRRVPQVSMKVEPARFK
jgi:hypothetical protein